ncbi:MAG: response regulator [Gemmatimonadales bacterium]|nr:response regulator [Gemmatimonadales bacterium]
MASTAGFQILLVDDEPAGVRLTLETLRDSAVPKQVSVVHDGVEALAYLRREGRYAGAARPDLVILDLNMPRKNGREVLAEVKSDRDLRRIPVVVLTTSDAEEDVRCSYDLHANCYLTKPADLHQFATIMRRLEEFWLAAVRLPPA